MNPEMSAPLSDAASQILILTGLVQVLWGLLTGMPMGTLRLKGGEVPRYLTLAHMGGLMQGPLLFGLVFAVRLSGLSPGWETLGAATVALASVLLVLKDTLNWQMEVADEFAERPPGYYLGIVLGPLYLFGVLVLSAGVVLAVVG